MFLDVDQRLGLGGKGAAKSIKVSGSLGQSIVGVGIDVLAFDKVPLQQPLPTN